MSMEIQGHMEKEIKHLSNELSKEKKRALVTCKNCYELKPPIIVQMVDEDCKMCNGQKQYITLVEKKHDMPDLVDYLRIKHHTEACKLEICRVHQNAEWDFSQESCNFAHGNEEKLLWQAFLSSKTDGWDSFALCLSKLNKSEDTLQGCFHCAICSSNYNNSKLFSDHKETKKHKDLAENAKHSKSITWSFRKPKVAFMERVLICPSTDMDVECERGDECPNAHSQKELEEWKRRILLEQKERKLKYAKEKELLSFADQICLEFDETCSPASVVLEKIDGISFKSSKPCQNLHCQPNNFLEWKISLKTSDSEKRLSNVAFRKQKNFSICKVRGKRLSQYTTHIDYTLSTDDQGFVNNLAKFQVKFVADAESLGQNSDVLFVEFTDNERPLLMIKFSVFVSHELTKFEITPADSQPVPTNNWVKMRPVEPFPSPKTNQFDEELEKIVKKYKEPQVSLDFDPHTEFNSEILTQKNYVHEMHNFLYQEELARKNAISKLFCQSVGIGISNNYYSHKDGLVFLRDPNQLYGVFELPKYLTGETDEGLLVLDNCQKVLLSLDGSESDSSVYEAKVEEFCSEHAILIFSQMCVKDWNLSSGSLVRCDIQFQLNRSIFCMCHYALDALKDLERLPIMCPSVASYEPKSKQLQKPFSSEDLDSDQLKVMNHIVNDEPSFPLFVVIGPFGTGKTYTIGKCVLHLLRESAKVKVLICTHSNSAADLYIRNNFSSDDWKGKIIRVVYSDRKLQSVPEDVRKHCLFNESKTGFVYPTTEQICDQNVQVVITTFTQSLVLGLMGTGLNGVFSHIFLDEAAQAMEPEAIIPLTVASSKTTKVVIAGDHMQITQKVYSKKFGSQAVNTIVERMYLLYKRKEFTELYTPHENHVFLTNNYRCVEPILDVIQEVFYKKGLLRCCSKEQAIRSLSPVQFCHVGGTCAQDPSTGGYYNVEEAMTVSGLIYELMQYPDLDESDIVVVASYSIQVKCLRDILRRNGFRLVCVDRVRNIQGLEFKVVIMSCVHSFSKLNDENLNLGLLSDVGLLNTAITRSKIAVIAVGNAVTLCSLGKCHLRWNYYIKYCSLHSSLLPNFVSYNLIMHEVAKISKLNPEVKEFVPSQKRRAISEPQPKSEESNSSQEKVLDDLELEEEETDSEESDSFEVPMSLNDDKILLDKIQEELGFSPDKMAIRVDEVGMEYLEEVDPNEPEPCFKDLEARRVVIFQKFTVPQLKTLLKEKPEEYKKCTLNLKNYYSGEAIVLNPNDDIKKISLNSKKNLGRCFDKDTVVVGLNKYTKTGKVIGVLQSYKKPTKREFVCLPDLIKPSQFMLPVDYKMPKFAILRPKDSDKQRPNQVPIYSFKQKGKNGINCNLERWEKINPHAHNQGGGKLFIVKYLRWSETSPYPLGYVADVVHAKDAEKYFSIAYEVPPPHSKDLEEMGKQAVDANKEKRVDLTDLFVFTIDPPGSTDLDDALSITKCEEHDSDCFKIGIHIADVASVVDDEGRIDKEARNRGTTFYDPEILKEKRKNSPMLPKSLSSGKCSLLPNKRRPAITTFFHTCDEIDISNADAYVPIPQLTLIESKCQMTYKEAEEKLSMARRERSVNLMEMNENTLPQQLYQIWLFMRNMRHRRLDFAVYHSQSDISKVEEMCEEGLAHVLIEEAMITLNACTTLFLKKNNCQFFLLCQSPPDEEEFDSWKKLHAQQIQLSLYLKSRDIFENVQNSCQDEDADTAMKNKSFYVWPQVLDAIQNVMSGSDIDLLLSLLCCESLYPAFYPAIKSFTKIQKKATLVLTPKAYDNYLNNFFQHYSLNLPFYSWCSSPIRRYPDVVAQRELISKLSELQDQTTPEKVDSNVVVLATRQESKKTRHLNELCNKIFVRQNDAKEYEKQLSNFVLAKNMLAQENRSYQPVVVTEITNTEIGFSCLKQKLNQKASSLRYRDLHSKSVWGKIMQSESPDRHYKILDSNKLTWVIRFYCVNSTEAETEIGDFKPMQVSTQMMQELTNTLSGVLQSLDENLSEHSVKKEIRKVLKTRKQIGFCRRNQSMSEPCNHKVCCQKDSDCQDYWTYRTRNDILHARKITINFEPGLPLNVQFYPKLERGLLTPRLQLLCLKPDLDLCVAHLNDPVETFAADVVPARAQGDHKSLEQYARSWLPVLRLDGIYHAVNDGNPITFSGVEIDWEEHGEFGSFVMDKGFCDTRMINFQRDAFLCIRKKNQTNTEGGHYTWVCHALIKGVDADQPKTMEILFRACPILPKITEQENLSCSAGTYVVEFIELLTPHRRMASALQGLKKCKENRILEMLCIGFIHPERILYSDEEGKIMKLFQSIGKKLNFMTFRLNAGQIDQAKKAFNNNLTLIQGPPGTGKSFLGAHLVYYFNQINCIKDNKKCILYCGPSNKSVDVVAEILMKSNMRILRVYGKTMEELSYANPLKPDMQNQSKDKPDPKLKQITLHERIRMEGNPFANEIKKFDKKFQDKTQKVVYKEYVIYKNTVGKAKQFELSKHDVIISTCTSAAMKLFQPNKKSKYTRLETLQFSHCIIDEAAMCSEPETITPAFFVNPDQLVLIGDHKQLQPIVQCKRAKACGLDVSMFERLMSSEVLENYSNMLTTQYRMNPTICEFPSMHFYGGRLMTDPSVIQREQTNPPVLNFPFSLDVENTAVFVNVQTEEETSSSKFDLGGLFSKFNSGEARAVIQILRWLHFTKEIPLNRIMILSPYQAQCTMIKNLIKEERSSLSSVHVETVVTSQGSEKDYVILSTVRSKPTDFMEETPNIHWIRRNLGFVTDRHQINVAITRAKTGLLIVGNKDLLSKDAATWEKLIQSYESRGSVLDFLDAQAPWNV